MMLPYTSNSLLFFLDPSERNVLRDSSNNLISVVERLSGIPLTSDTGAKPSWADNVINGHPAFTFAGAQNLRFNFNRSVVSVGTGKPVAIMAVAKGDTAAFGGLGSVLYDLGSQTNTTVGLDLDFITSTGNKVITARFDDAGGTDFGTAVAADTKFHLYTTIYDGSHLKLRIDGMQKDNVAATGSTGHFDGDQLSIGDYTAATANATSHVYFTGKVATVLVYEGLNGDIDLTPETWLGQYYGLF